MTHGTRSAYVNRKCRCDLCTAANRAYMSAKRAEWKEMETPASVHGTWGGYTNWSCRCALCTAIHSEGCREYNLRRKAATS